MQHLWQKHVSTLFINFNTPETTFGLKTPSCSVSPTKNLFNNIDYQDLLNTSNFINLNNEIKKTDNLQLNLKKSSIRRKIKIL